MKRVVEITSECQIHKVRGSLVISRNGQANLSIPVHEIGCVNLSAVAGGTISINSIRAIIDEGASIVLTDNKCFPVAQLHSHNSTLDAHEKLILQMGLSEPRRKQIWADVVRGKIAAQKSLICPADKIAHTRMSFLLGRILSGDTSNVEAQAARVYWSAIMGTDFKRQDDDLIQNHLLNYGYTILRAAVLRCIVAKGLSPLIALHHSPRINYGALADDLMEIFRPCVDRKIIKSEMSILNPASKVALVSVLQDEIKFHGGVYTVESALPVYIDDYINVMKGKGKKLSTDYCYVSE